MNLSRLFSPCCFGHAPDPLTVVQGKVMHHECRRCGEDLGAVLPGQKYKARKEKKRSRKSADVLRLEKRRA